MDKLECGKGTNEKITEFLGNENFKEFCTKLGEVGDFKMRKIINFVKENPPKGIELINTNKEPDEKDILKLLNCALGQLSNTEYQEKMLEEVLNNNVK